MRTDKISSQNTIHRDRQLDEQKQISPNQVLPMFLINFEVLIHPTLQHFSLRMSILVFNVQGDADRSGW